MNEESNKCRKIWYWVVQFLLWLFLILIINAEEYSFELVLPFVVIYLIYWVNFFYCDFYYFISHQQSGNKIYDYMSKLIYEPAFIDFTINCYHYETKQVYRNNKCTTETKMVNTYNIVESFKYMTCRDVSGPFLLNTQGYRSDPAKAIVKLKIDFDIELALDGTKNDYDAQLDSFIKKNQYLDTHYNFFVTNRLSNYSKFNLINIEGNQHSLINFNYFVVFTFFCVNELYKIFVDSYCIEQEYKIIKLISTRSNLNLADVFQPYEDRTPKIIIQNKEVIFNDPSRFSEVNSVDLPTLDEITPKYNQGAHNI